MTAVTTAQVAATATRLASYGIGEAITTTTVRAALVAARARLDAGEPPIRAVSAAAAVLFPADPHSAQSLAVTMDAITIGFLTPGRAV